MLVVKWSKTKFEYITTNWADVEFIGIFIESALMCLLFFFRLINKIASVEWQIFSHTHASHPN